MKKSILILSLAAFLVGCGSSVEPVKATTKTPEAEFIDSMVAKAQGDPSKLTAEERQKMDTITRGNTEIILKSTKK